VQCEKYIEQGNNRKLCIQKFIAEHGDKYRKTLTFTILCKVVQMFNKMAQQIIA
jgi:hypothetical protein